MAHIIADLATKQNVDLNEPIQFVDEGTGVPAVFTGSTFEMDIKTTGAGAVVLAATIGVDDIDEGRLTLTVLNGTIAVGNYVYDLIRITGSAREMLMEGEFFVLQGVTQP